MAEREVLEHSDVVAALGEIPGDKQHLAAILDRPIGDEFDLEEYLNDIQRNYLRRAMEEAKGVKAHAARLLGMKFAQ